MPTALHGHGNWRRSRSLLPDRLGLYHMVDTSGALAMKTAKVFMNGRSQAIRLPREYRVESDEVYLKRTPEGFLVIPKDPWEVFEEGLAELSGDWLEADRRHPGPERRGGAGE